MNHHAMVETPLQIVKHVHVWYKSNISQSKGEGKNHLEEYNEERFKKLVCNFPGVKQDEGSLTGTISDPISGQPSQVNA